MNTLMEKGEVESVRQILDNIKTQIIDSVKNQNDIIMKNHRQKIVLLECKSMLLKTIATLKTFGFTEDNLFYYYETINKIDNVEV